ncbi:MAG: hypothetical protein AAFX07_16865, partial [Pseudomonadota bacterium]
MELLLLILGAGVAASLVGGLGGGDGGSTSQNVSPTSPSGGTAGADLLVGTNFDDTLEGLAG